MSGEKGHESGPEVSRQVPSADADLAYFQSANLRYAIVPEKTAIVVICMQNGCLKPGYAMYSPRALAMVPRLRDFMELCRSRGILVIHTVSSRRGDGSDIGRMIDIHPMLRGSSIFLAGTDEVEVYGELSHPSDVVIEKHRYNAFFGTDLELVLRANGIDTLIISGTATEGCCEETACEAFARDYKVVFLSDGNAAEGLPDAGWGPISPEEAQRGTLTLVASSLGQVASIDEVSEAIRSA